MTLRLAIDKPLDRLGYTSAVAGALLVGVFVVVLLVLADALSGGRYYSLITNIGIALILTVGYQIFAGNTGIISFGHPAFVAVGAYAAGLLIVPVETKASVLPDLPGFIASIELPILPAVVIGGLAATVVAGIFGPAIARTHGAVAGIITFGVLMIVNETIRNLDTFTRGNQTFIGVPKLADFKSVFVTVIFVVLLSAAFKFSRAGLMARIVRDDPLAAETMGVSLAWARFWPWLISAFAMGCGGALMAAMLTAFSPTSFYINLVLPMMVMAVVGGLNSIAGALVGTIVLISWRELMRAMEGGDFGFSVPSGSSQLTLGILLLLILYARPGGLMGSYEVIPRAPLPLLRVFRGRR